MSESSDCRVVLSLVGVQPGSGGYATHRSKYCPFCDAALTEVVFAERVLRFLLYFVFGCLYGVGVNIELRRFFLRASLPAHAHAPFFIVSHYCAAAAPAAEAATVNPIIVAQVADLAPGALGGDSSHVLDALHQYVESQQQETVPAGAALSAEAIDIHERPVIETIHRHITSSDTEISDLKRKVLTALSPQPKELNSKAPNPCLSR